MSKVNSNKTQVIKDLESNNDTLRFLVPLLSSQEIIDNDLIIEGFKGAYLKDSNNLDLGEKLFLKYKPSKSEEFINADAKITSLGGYVADYDKDDYIVYVIEIENEFEDTLKLFKEGNYSQFTDKHKDRIAKFWQLLDDRNDPLSGVIYQTETGTAFYQNLPEELQKLSAENELWPIPNMSQETL